MTFANPAMLWALLALAPLIGVYFLKVRPRRRPITAYFLWEKIFQQRRPNRLWQRLRSLWSLLLMALAFAAVAMALAEPRFKNQDRPDLLILIDNSASMQATVGSSTRLDLAKREAADVVRALDGVQRVAIATVADRLRYQSHLTDNPRELLAAINSVEPTDEAFRSEALATTVGHQATDQPDREAESPSVEGTGLPHVWSQSRRVLLLSDGVLGGHDPPDGVELVCIDDEPADNTGLVAADLQFVPGAGDRLTFYYQIASTSATPREVDLILSRLTDTGQEQLQKVIPVTTQQGVNTPQCVDGGKRATWPLGCAARRRRRSCCRRRCVHGGAPSAPG